MIRESLRNPNLPRCRPALPVLAALLAMFIAAQQLRSDEPYARSRDYHDYHAQGHRDQQLDEGKALVAAG